MENQPNMSGEEGRNTGWDDIGETKIETERPPAIDVSQAVREKGQISIFLK